MKQAKEPQSTQAAGNQQQPLRYNVHTVKKSLNGTGGNIMQGNSNSLTRNLDQGSFAEREKSSEVKQNNFIPSSNLSQFLLKKGSNGSLHTFENEYSYKINLNNLNQAPVSSTKQKKSNLNKKNNLFKEVIVEDEAEDIRGSQMGSNTD